MLRQVIKSRGTGFFRQSTRLANRRAFSSDDSQDNGNKKSDWSAAQRLFGLLGVVGVSGLAFKLLKSNTQSGFEDVKMPIGISSEKGKSESKAIEQELTMLQSMEPEPDEMIVVEEAFQKKNDSGSSAENNKNKLTALHSNDEKANLEFPSDSEKNENEIALKSTTKTKTESPQKLIDEAPKDSKEISNFEAISEEKKPLGNMASNSKDNQIKSTLNAANQLESSNPPTTRLPSEANSEKTQTEESPASSEISSRKEAVKQNDGVGGTQTVNSSFSAAKESTGESASLAPTPSIKSTLVAETREYVDKHFKDIPDTSFSELDFNRPFEKERAIVLTIPILFNENAVGAVADFLKKLQQKDPRPIKVFYRIISETEDFGKIESHTGIGFKASDSVFNTIAIFHEELNSYLPYRLSDIIYPQKRIFKDFKSVALVNSESDLLDLAKKFPKDEIAVVFAQGDQLGHNEKIREFIYKNPQINLEKVNLVRLGPDFKPSEGSLINSDLTILLKTKANEQGNSSSQIKALNLADFSNKSLNEINAEFSKMVNNEIVFSNNFFRGQAAKYQIEIVFDKNSHEQRDLDKIRLICKSVKERLGYLSPLFEFSVVNRCVHNSEKQRIPIFGYDAELIQKQMNLLYQNTSREIFEKAKKENPELTKYSNNTFRYSSEGLSAANLSDFCNQIAENKAELLTLSQRPLEFQKYSRRVVGQTFQQSVIDSPFDQAIFYYSKNCGSCKRFLPLFEELAKENLLKDNTEVIFNRINNNENQSRFQPVYVSTPRIVLYRKESKSHPFEYHSNRLSKEMLRQFIDVTLAFDIIQPELKMNEILNTGSQFFSKLSGLNKLIDLK